MTAALLIVDVQNDFAEGGALGVTGGDAVARGVSALLRDRGDACDLVVASRDWHDPDSDNGGHFATDTDPDFVTTWPVHCVAGSPGAEYHPDFDTTPVEIHIRKGQGRPAYSAFEGTTEDGRGLGRILADHGIDRVDIAGLATDYCVRASTLDAIAEGLAVRVLTDLVAGVAAGSSQRSLDEIVEAGGELI